MATGDITLITDGKGRNSEPTFSHDGKFVAYTSTRRNGTDTDLYVENPLDPRTDHLLAPVQGGGWQVQDWSADGKKLLVIEEISVNESYLWAGRRADRRENRADAPARAGRAHGRLRQRALRRRPIGLLRDHRPGQRVPASRLVRLRHEESPPGDARHRPVQHLRPGRLRPLARWQPARGSAQRQGREPGLCLRLQPGAVPGERIGRPRDGEHDHQRPQVAAGRRGAGLHRRRGADARGRVHGAVRGRVPTSCSTRAATAGRRRSA